MSDVSLAIQKEVFGLLFSKAVVVNREGDLSVDGTSISGLDGKRSLKLFAEGVEQDVIECGPAKAVKLYRRKSRIPGSLGKALQSSVNLTRILEAEEISRK
jgi:hypothetical protein